MNSIGSEWNGMEWTLSQQTWLKEKEEEENISIKHINTWTGEVFLESSGISLIS